VRWAVRQSRQPIAVACRPWFCYRARNPTMTFVRSIFGPSDNDDAEVENPTWNHVHSALCALDGRRRTLIVLRGRNEEECLSIGGGPARLVCYYTNDNISFLNAKADQTGACGRVSVVAGGQRADFPASRCITTDQAVRIARVFFETGQLDPESIWEPS
jgi:hypothetical protein